MPATLPFMSAYVAPGHRRTIKQKTKERFRLMRKNNARVGKMGPSWRQLLVALLLPLLFLLASLASPMAFASSASHASWDPTDPCGTGTMQSVIQITSTGGWPSLWPITSISIDPCTLTFLMQHGDPSRVSVQSD